MAGKHLSVPLQIGKQGLWEEFKQNEKQTELEGEQYAYSKKKKKKIKNLERVERDVSFTSGGRMALFESIGACWIS